MKKSRFTEQQIISVLKEVEIDAKVNATCRKYGISDATCYKWKSAYAGMEVSHLRQLRDLQAENARLKKMYADLALVHHALQGMSSAESPSPIAQS